MGARIRGRDADGCDRDGRATRSLAGDSGENGRMDLGFGPSLICSINAANATMTQPKHSFACAGFHATRLSRRHALKVGGLGLLGLTLPKLLQAESFRTASASARAPMAR